ncbi:hypothetical protein [Hahella sp. NBU794]|uniref:hypothetical protein n=1 Tax=Hahella sp. NBU794 TaxID=3422590 RepID=UPI003D6E6056
MSKKIQKELRLAVLTLLATFLFGCSTQKLTISHAELLPIDVKETKKWANGDPYLFDGDYLVITFKSDQPIDTEDFLNQFRATIVKGNDEVDFFDGTLDGVYPNYRSFHECLTYLKTFEFDRIDFQLRYDPMIIPDYTSNVISFTKEEVLEATQKPMLEYKQAFE